MALEPIEVTTGRYGSIPHSYLVRARDNAVRPALQRLMVREIDAVSARPTGVVEIDSSHSPFLSPPATLAEVIEAAHTALRAADEPARTARV
ncbi:hypothetical protein OHN99_33430 [Streptomyces jietaisiensis]|uniref:Alpha/beta hydrolase family protein n=2 Tax=Streptomyces griseoaurantiacus TaxID=68213 RepID=A0ABZ1VC81_9ACTN